MYPPVPAVYSAEDRVTNIIRTLLALSALLIVLIDPEKPRGTQISILIILAVMNCYSMLIDILWEKSHRIERFAASQAHWVDVGLCAVLIAFSGRVHSIFYFGFLFPIIVSSVRRGFATGLCVTVTSTAIFAAIGLLPPQTQPALEMNRFLIKAIW